MLFFILLIIMTMMGAVAALFLKKASEFKSLKHLAFNKNLYIGGGLYFLSAILNIYILRSLEYSIVLPLTSITYIWTMIISYFILKEKVTTKKIFGIIFIFFGALLITIK
ncbi:EamA family transporter [Clostridium sp. C2-6-12]|uniref:EamA family transporter n=1 Tax=Clostridium sp. C2-6-12 TaxID=2698832 RepID=UPI00136913E7|nr:EamA family transporter [Clostridium sp. C2-6-12]